MSNPPAHAPYDPARIAIVAEAGVNHNGQADLALALVEAAAGTGADAVKFQTFDADELAAPAAPSATYQLRAGQAARQKDMLAGLELAPAALKAAWRRAESLGLEALSTPFDLASARFLVGDLGMGRIKVGSGELTNLPLIVELARLGPPLILSTGMAEMDEVRDALGAVVFGRLQPEGRPAGLAALREALSSTEAAAILAQTTVMQCVTEYPAPLDQANLRVMDSYAALGVRPGYSDHTPGIAAALAAAARGAVMIEKHLTLSRDMPGPDHAASLEPPTFAELVAGVRQVETLLGSSVKRPVPAEQANRDVARRCVVAARPLRAGQVLGPGDLAARRAGPGRPPADLWTLEGSTARRDYRTGEPIDP